MLPFEGEIIFVLKIIKMGGIDQGDQGLVIRILVLTTYASLLDLRPPRSTALPASLLDLFTSTPEHFCVSWIFSMRQNKKVRSQNLSHILKTKKTEK